MHRHGYQGRKFHRERDQRRALIKGLADSLVKYESIETTLPKAKELVPYMEKLITKAKKGDLHIRRQVISKLQTVESAHKLVDQIAPKLSDRSSGHLRIEKTGLRRGDNSHLAKVSFVDDIKPEVGTRKQGAGEKVAKPNVTAKPVKTLKPTSRTKTGSKSVAKRPATRAAQVKAAKEAK